MKSIEGKIRSSRSRRMVFAFVLVAGVATQSISLSPGAAFADGGRDHRRADVTFTKWVITLPTDPTTLAGILMAGVVGGDVGPGRFAGEVLSDDTTSRPGFWLAHARYEFHGRDHTFVADVRVTEDDTKVPSAATIRGVVTKGWLSGNVFRNNVLSGTLHLQFARSDG